MNKHELIESLAFRCGLSQSEAAELFEATFRVLTETLSQNKSISIPDFGTFENHLRKSHRYFDLFRKKIMVAPKKLSVSFHVSAFLKEKLHDVSERS